MLFIANEPYLTLKKVIGTSFRGGALASYHHGRNNKHGVVQISTKVGCLIIGGGLSTSITPKTNQCQWKIDGAESLPFICFESPSSSISKVSWDRLDPRGDICCGYDIFYMLECLHI